MLRPNASAVANLGEVATVIDHLLHVNAQLKARTAEQARHPLHA